MTAQELHQKNIELYLTNGGSDKLAKQYKLPSLQNRAKIIYLLKNQIKTPFTEEITERKSSENTEEKPTKPEESNLLQNTPHHKMIGYISQYPEALHSTYSKAFNAWLKTCSLKIKLNRIPDENESEAYEVQCEIWDCIEEFDACKKRLDYFKNENVVLPGEVKVDFSKLSDLELDRRLRNLRPLITRRNSTLKKQLENLPDKSDVKFHRKKAAYTKKLEELEKYKLEVREIEGELQKRFGSK